MNLFGADNSIDIEKEDVVERVSELTSGDMADVVVDVAGNPAAIMNIFGSRIVIIFSSCPRK